jgi:hypothetical protein
MYNLNMYAFCVQKIVFLNKYFFNKNKIAVGRFCNDSVSFHIKVHYANLDNCGTCAYSMIDKSFKKLK